EEAQTLRRIIVRESDLTISEEGMSALDQLVTAASSSSEETKPRVKRSQIVSSDIPIEQRLPLLDDEDGYVHVERLGGRVVVAVLADAIDVVDDAPAGDKNDE